MPTLIFVMLGILSMMNRGLFALLALFATACANHYANCSADIAPRMPANFKQLTDANGNLIAVYRGAAPSGCAELAYLKQQKITSILRLNKPKLSPNFEADAAKSLGFAIDAYDFSPFTIGRPATCPRVNEALHDLVRAYDEHQPIYVHCSLGRDRTGYIIGMFERLVLHESRGPVLDELAERGHRCLSRTLYPQIHRVLAADHPACP
jgi:predicted protein tyrosine phosphatase